MRIHSVLAFLAVSLLAASPARADLVIQGKDAQKLHCAAMLLLVSDVLNREGRLSEQELNFSISMASALLTQLPGTQGQKLQALNQRAEKIVRSRSLEDLAKEFRSTAKWCARNTLQ